MVTGMATFRRHFAGYEDAFVVIGGAACDEWFTRVGGRFRATKDIDMVLVLDATQPRFFAHFWDFIKSGRYEVGQRSDGERTFFRFQKPADPEYPKMIELLSTAPMEIDPFPGQQIVPIPAGEDVSSLSAILMDPVYYQFIMSQRELVDGLPLIKPAGLIVLKAKAWLDLTRRRAEGDKAVKDDDVNKHRTDVFRLTAILPVGETLAVPAPIAADLASFTVSFPLSSAEWPAIRQSLQTGGIGMAANDLIRTFRFFFTLPEANV
ncbi:MAG: hypothetical protein V1929_05560 [bacterium]